MKNHISITLQNPEQFGTYNLFTPIKQSQLTELEDKKIKTLEYLKKLQAKINREKRSKQNSLQSSSNITETSYLLKSQLKKQLLNEQSHYLQLNQNNRERQGQPEKDPKKKLFQPNFYLNYLKTKCQFNEDQFLKTQGKTFLAKQKSRSIPTCSQLFLRKRKTNLPQLSNMLETQKLASLQSCSRPKQMLLGITSSDDNKILEKSSKRPYFKSPKIDILLSQSPYLKNNNKSTHQNEFKNSKYSIQCQIDQIFCNAPDKIQSPKHKTNLQINKTNLELNSPLAGFFANSPKTSSLSFSPKTDKSQSPKSKRTQSIKKSKFNLKLNINQSTQFTEQINKIEEEPYASNATNNANICRPKKFKDQPKIYFSDNDLFPQANQLSQLKNFSSNNEKNYETLLKLWKQDEEQI